MSSADDATPISLVLLARSGESTQVLHNHLQRAFGIGGVVIEDPVPRRQFLRRRVQRLGLATVAGQILFQLTAVPYLSLISRARATQIKRDHRLDHSPIAENAITSVPSVNSEAAREVLRSLDPDVVVLSGTRIVSPETLRSVPATFLNVHAGITPRYRGVHGGYWSLAEGDREDFGVTVHVVDEGVDTGPVLAQARLEPTDRDSFATYPLLQLAAGLPHLVEAVERAARGDLRPVAAPSGPSRLWSHPTLAQYIANRRRVGVR